jgi:hypothetical protein
MTDEENPDIAQIAETAASEAIAVGDIIPRDRDGTYCLKKNNKNETRRRKLPRKSIKT